MSAQVAGSQASRRWKVPTHLFGGRISVQTAILVVLLVVGGCGLMWLGRRLGFYFDEWTTLIEPQGGIDSYLRPFNEHLSILPTIIYRALMATAGIGHYWPYRLVLVLAHLSCVALVYVLVRRRLGAWAALIPAVLMLFMSSSAENILWAATMTPVLSIAFGLGAFVLLDHPSKRNDIWACVLLTLSVTTTGQGLAFLAAVGIQVLLEPRRLRRCWIFIIPLALYLLWRAGYEVASSAPSTNKDYAVQYIVDAASAAAAGILGLALTYGPVILVGAIAAVAILRRGDVTAPKPSPRFAAILVAALSFWALTALARAQFGEPGAPRYVSFGAIMLMLAAAEMLPRPRRWTPWMGATAIVLVGAFTFGNMFHLRDASRFFQAHWYPLRGEMAGIEVAGAAANQGQVLDPVAVPTMTIGQYLRVARDFGSGSGGLKFLTGSAAQSFRQTADGTLARVEGVVALKPLSSAAPPADGSALAAQDVLNGTVRTSGRCVVFTPGKAGPPSFVVPILPGTAVAVSSRRSGPPIGVTLRRFSEQFTVTPTPIAVPGGAVVRTKRDLAPGRSWDLYVAPQATTKVCPA